ncbi:hypothetical protein ADIS_4064 [Lunatimonas lonarensis]|uniref:Uncharacterized protein n=1 Tax=Lunatimonas lonarensis TaxID=1232681 RepID=R7ZMN2_9BACT|nr:hypothetical protein [Lunatimonas lonarensis]EON75360.1 hypothetical protein ADIS_4064 [Lunatimonas lonarensis]
MDDKQVDRLFREKLSGFEMKPKPDSWSRLEGRLSIPKKPHRYHRIWQAAAVVVLGMLGFLAWELVPFRDEPTADHLATSISEDFSMPLEIAIPAPELVEKRQRPREPSKITPSPRKAVAVVGTPELPPKKEEEVSSDISGSEGWKLDDLALEAGFISEIEVGIEPEAADIGEGLVADEPLLVRVRLVSKGYAFAPDKPDLIEGIEDGIEKLSGLMAKVDKGFADLQDVKNNFFSSVGSQMRNRKELR